jgi:FkbM family methyltransferase
MDYSDYRQANWFGVKKYVKAMLGFGPINLVWRPLLRRFLSPSQCRRLPVSLPEVDGIVRGHHFTLLEPMRCNIAKELYWGHGRRVKPSEAYALELFCALAEEADVVFDIGANTGLFSIASARSNPKADLHAFEIVPEVFALLYQNVVRNNLLSRIFCHSFGIGVDRFEMVIPSSAPGSSLPIGFSSKDRFAQGTTVGFRSLDSQLPFVRSGQRVLVKVDVEGTELDILRHGQEFIGTMQPDIVCEILPAADGDSVSDYLHRHRYTAYMICDGYLMKAEHVTPDRRYHDWLFTQRSVADMNARTSIRASADNT